MGSKLYVGNISYTSNDDHLAGIFSQCGEVISARVIIDRETGRSKGFGFVEMATDDEARNAIEQLNGQALDGRPLTVNEARPQEPRTRPGFGAPRGGFNNRR